MNPAPPAKPQLPGNACGLSAACDSAKPSARGTNYFCPVCKHEFLPEEIGKKPYCRRCGYLES